MARLKTFDAKLAPANWSGAERTPTTNPKHYTEVQVIFAERTEDRDEVFRQEAWSFLEDWRVNQPSGYEGRKARELVSAAILAISIRTGMREQS